MAVKSERKILNISLPSELYRAVERLATGQAKAKGEFVREALRQYVASEERWKRIRGWGRESGKSLRVQNQSDVAGVVEEYRKEVSS